jgi:hypothetical protein
LKLIVKISFPGKITISNGKETKKWADKNKQGFIRPDDDYFFDMNTVASTTECTGLIPTPPVSEFEAESYTDIYGIPQPSGGKRTEKSVLKRSGTHKIPGAG